MFGVLLVAELPNRGPGWVLVLLLLPAPPNSPPGAGGNSVDFGAVVLGVPVGVEDGAPKRPPPDCDPNDAVFGAGIEVKANGAVVEGVAEGDALVVPAPPNELPAVQAGCPDGLLSFLSLFAFELLLLLPPPPAAFAGKNDIRFLGRVGWGGVEGMGSSQATVGADGNGRLKHCSSEKVKTL